MKRLVAVSSVLLGNICYEPGDGLPANDAGLVEAWTKNGAAAWKDEEELKEHGVKARCAAALAGLIGDAYPSAGPGNDLAGKPPPRSARGAQPEPSKRGRKSSG